MNEQEKRIKTLEENLAWLQRDMVHLLNIVESLKPEIHHHYTTIIYTKPCMDDPNNTNNLKDYI
jgi:hypothetical protein